MAVILPEQNYENQQILCEHNGNFFVSEILRDDDLGLYVDDVKSKIVIPLNEVNAWVIKNV